MPVLQRLWRYYPCQRNGADRSRARSVASKALQRPIWLSSYHTISKVFLALGLCMSASVKQGATKKKWLRLLNCCLFSSSPQSLPVGGDTSNKPFEWTGRPLLSASPLLASCLPLKGSVGQSDGRATKANQRFLAGEDMLQLRKTQRTCVKIN
jgi:hypothetical protein